MTRRDLSPEAIRQTVRFLREPENRRLFVQRLDDWAIAADALEEAGLTYHAQQIRSLIRLGMDRRFPFHEHRPLTDLSTEAAAALGPNGAAPRSIWGHVMPYDGTLYSPLYLDSIYVRGYPSVRVELVAGSAKHLRSGATQQTFRATYAGHRYSGRSSHVYLGRDLGWSGWIQLFRGASLRRKRRGG